MGVSVFHVLEQGQMLRTIGGVALSLLGDTSKRARLEPPGPWIEEAIRPRPAKLLRDYVRHVGGDPAWYKGQVPAHMFPQWSLHLAGRALASSPYPVARAINAGCRLELRAPLPANEHLHVRARLEAVDDDGRRALVTQRIITGTASVPEAVVADLRVFIPLEKRSGKKGGKAEPSPKSAEKKARPTVPDRAKELSFLRLSATAGLDFAKLTGDFNPVHWVPAYARAAGFQSCILHGFATMARALEALNRNLFVGDTRRLAVVDVRFTRPLVLPARVGVYVSDNNGLFVGDAPGGGAYLEGTFETRVSA